jgi:hypothetical protein
MIYASSRVGRGEWLEGGATGEGSPTMMVDRRWRSVVRQPSPASRDPAKPGSSTYVTRGTYCAREREERRRRSLATTSTNTAVLSGKVSVVEERAMWPHPSSIHCVERMRR